MAEDFAADLARLQAACLADLKEAMPRSEMGRALMAELAAEEARERASRRCSDCVHWDAGASYDTRDMVVDVVMRCEKGLWGYTDIRSMFRAAASCPDYEEVRESEEGVER